MQYRTINLKVDLPILDEARRRLLAEIRTARRQGLRVLKVIHGYGSTGKGGQLCVGLRRSLRLRTKEGVIRGFLPGEDFSIFNETTLALLEVAPVLRGDPDLNAVNPGVTLVWLR
jgi:hypothetical protein